MVEYIVIAVLMAGAGFWIMKPLLQSETIDLSPAADTDETLRQLEAQKEGAYATIRDLEFDLRMGKLSARDFEELEKQYKKEAVDCLKAIDDFNVHKNEKMGLTEEGLDTKLEREILALRTKESVEKNYVYCTQCGFKASHSDRFCSACGVKLLKPELSLPRV
jgi:ribosomal protein S27AE